VWAMKILIATRTPEGLPGGSGFHLRNMLECLEKNGHDVIVWCLDGGNYDAPLDGRELAEFLAHYTAHKPDALIADYSWMCPAFDELPASVLKICFVHDLRCRIIPCLTAIGYQSVQGWIGYKDAQGWTEEKEAALLRKADVLLVLNNDDAEYCRRMAPDAKVIRVGIAMDAVEHNPAKEISGRCIYVGSCNMENLWAIGWFEREVWPRVLAEVPHATLDKVFGHPDDIEQHYAEAQIAVVPHIMKGGMKIKTAEALAHGLPVVGNVCAFDGIDDRDYMGYATDDPNVMVEKISWGLRLIFPRIKAYLKSYDYVQNHMTPHTAYGNLLDILV